MFSTAISAFVVSIVLGPCLGLGSAELLDVAQPFAPVGRYAGHWGIDVRQAGGAPVRSVGNGVVTFSGSIAGRNSVTVQYGSDVRASYSYLQRRFVGLGDTVRRGQAVGLSGIHGGILAFHLSLRVNGEYVDPIAALRCRQITSRVLYLATTVNRYPRGRDRHPRRNLRPTPRCSPVGGSRRV